MIVSDLIKTRILLIGSNGMLGQRITSYYKNISNVELLCCSAEEKSFFPDVEYKQLDIVQKEKVKEVIIGFVPDVIINAAAYTNVDKAESEKELAWKINVSGIENICLYAWTIDSLLIHFSTDYIFDGKNGPYSEDDKPNPIGYYGRTKLAAENSIRTNGVRYSIIRTNVLYGPVLFGRPDFVKWVVNSLKEEKEIKIVTDQINNPTFIDDIVRAVSSIITEKKEGIFNIGGKEFLNRFEFTRRIAKYFNLSEKLILPIITKDLNQPAPRPLKSGLIITKAQNELLYHPISIEESLLIIKNEVF